MGGCEVNQRFEKILRRILVIISASVILIGLYDSIKGIEHEKIVMEDLP